MASLHGALTGAFIVLTAFLVWHFTRSLDWSIVSGVGVFFIGLAHFVFLMSRKYGEAS